MRDVAAILNYYLVNRFGTTLERALLDATSDVFTLAMHGSVEVACDPVGRFEYADGGVSEQYQGVISVEGVIYRFRCSTFTDASGARYVESIGELEVVRWGVRLAVSHGRAQGRT